MWYALYEITTGRLISSGSSITDNIPEGQAVKVFPSIPSLLWNEQTLEFDAEPPAPRVELTPLQFLQRFTVYERVAIRGASKTDPIIEDFLDMINAASAFEGGHPLLMQGLGYMIQQGLITPERAAEVGDF